MESRSRAGRNFFNRTLVEKYIEFPVTVAILAHDTSSLFAGKSHALLCRNWEKGRDWFDFIWYVGKKTPLNYSLLSNALNQMGPWPDSTTQVFLS